MFPADLDDLIRRCLAEDVGPGDLTTEALVDPGARARGEFRVREDGVVAGLPVAARVFALVDERIVFTPHVAEGTRVTAGETLAVVEGPARGILTGERLALNFLQRLCGIATLTARLAVLIAGHPARLLDTRKTTPGLRALEKYAVRAGGGHNHRFGLYDGILIKDNHILVAGGVREAVARARAAAPHTLRIEVEAETLEQVEEALDAGSDVILLDNMDPATVRRAVELVGGRCLLEASGGIRESNIAAFAATGVDYISLGALTHSARALDIGLDFIPEGAAGR
ncbi:MAG: carboxylating nicotinate-nucleotide diphosphorylase [Thermoanaerobacterales bacterium]|nr:carboxylating nicotinate-nucleotide diphosphorylase [Bacillota bacterium]MDI6907765.1 carboxylating nicotinate-nucleotide diphosphorylase [Thermoanaerobacterales bacterium]